MTVCFSVHIRINRYSTATDVFSFAVVLSEIASNKLPWTGYTNIAAALAVVQVDVCDHCFSYVTHACVVQGKRTPMPVVADERLIECAALCCRQSPHDVGCVVCLSCC
jgi:hypothetical protein